MKITRLIVLSVALATLLPARFVGFAGWSYLTYGPLLTWNGMREERGRRPLIAAARDTTLERRRT